MTASLLMRDDLAWALDVLARRRRALVDLAPVFWRPAADALERHRTYLDHLLSAGARGFRTAGSVLFAAPRGEGWLVDDAAVEGAAPASEWQHLWDAFAALPAALTRAPELGCAAIVVAQRAGDEDLAPVLDASGFRRHCDYYEGPIGPM